MAKLLQDELNRMKEAFDSVDLFGGIKKKIEDFKQRIEDFKREWNQFWDSLLASAMAYPAMIGTAFDILVGVIEGGWRIIGNKTTEFIALFTNALEGGWNFVSGKATDFIGLVTQTLESGWNTISGKATDFIGGFTQTLGTGTDTAFNLISTAWNTFSSAFTVAWSHGWGLVSSAFKTIWFALPGIVREQFLYIGYFVWEGLSKLPGIILGFAQSFWNAGKSLGMQLFQGFMSQFPGGNFLGGLGISIVGTGKGFVDNILGRASGGHASGWTMVGERGRELVNFDTGFVLNNMRTERMLAASSGFTSLGGGARGGDTTIVINGNLEFPSVRGGGDADAFVRNLKTLAG
jgi:hypothetical protein